MVNMSRAMENIAAYIDGELVPKMPKLEGIAFAAMAPFVIKAKIPSLMKLTQGTELIDGENIDVDALYHEFKSKAQGKWPIEAFGFVFREDDLDKLYRYLVR